jgi:hypothetical protein
MQNPQELQGLGASMWWPQDHENNKSFKVVVEVGA